MTYDIAIIGAGPGGYVAAIRAAQLGAKVALIEKANVGGICLNWGCIPSKTFLSSADKYVEAKRLNKFGIKIENLSYDYGEIFQRKEQIIQKLTKGVSQLIKANNIDLIKGEACIESTNSLKILSESEEQIIEFKNLIIATGSRPTSLPGVEIDHEFVLDTNDILSLQELPESVLIVGSGASGIEWTRIFSSFDKKVTLVDIAESLCPMADTSISQALEKMLKRKRINFYTGTSIEKIENKKITLSNGKEIEPDIIFLAAGRLPNTEIKGIEKLNIEFNRKFFKVDENLKTSTDNIYAIGDVNGIYPVAHVASHQGVAAVEHILQNKQAHIDYTCTPSVIYGHPEIASVGLNEKQLEERGIKYKKSIFPMPAIGKATVEAEIDGFVKILANDEDILGVHIIANNAAEMLQQLAIAKSTGIKPEQLKDVIFAHPTYSEAIHESILGLTKEALHLPPGFIPRI